MQQAKRQCKGDIKNEYQCCKIFNRYRNTARLAGNGTPNIYAERGEGGNRSDSIETKMRKRSKETDQAKLLPKRRCFSHCIRQI